MSTNHPLIPADDHTLSNAHASSPCDTLEETTRRALALYALLENPEMLLAEHNDPNISEDEVDRSHR